MFKREDITELIDMSKLKDLLSRAKKEEVVVEKKKCPWKCILGVALVIAAIGGIAYALYRYFSPDYEDEFMDDFDDDDEEDDLFEDDSLDDEEE